eukprot:gnl/TRDRNA2_/TRDRNA2_174700_c8_seq1.p1 gnl/TRDRNA2_/TRDRNA2_174700_c8~~gnl/TRDRNA2_/TRDRNA2_174700_c8_seq1.p1  ORF type:complete len:179 (-),score=6.97 gnl/TRDRNA2_/TRDRNA2_174700_c8_seq1:32-568(-)
MSYALSLLTCCTALCANTLKSRSSDWLADVNAQAVFERPCGANAATCHSAALANALSSYAWDPHIAELRFCETAHTMLPMLCALNSLTCRIAALASITKSITCVCLVVANAQAVLVRSYGVKLQSRLFVAIANTVNSLSSDWLTVANAHTVPARSLLLKSPTCHSDALASAPHSHTSD